MAASAGHAVAYTIDPIFKHIVDCVQLTHSSNNFKLRFWLKNYEKKMKQNNCQIILGPPFNVFFFLTSWRCLPWGLKCGRHLTNTLPSRLRWIFENWVHQFDSFIIMIIHQIISVVIYHHKAHHTHKLLSYITIRLIHGTQIHHDRSHT